MILHTINKASALEKCSAIIQPGDAVLLLEDGVYLGMEQQAFEPLVLADDAEARGIQHRLISSKLVSFTEFVDLTARADKVCAWY